MKIKVVAMVLLLAGCSSKPLFYDDFSPPKDSKQVHIKVDLPPTIDALPLNVMYRSYKCKVSRRVSEREYRDVPGFHNMEVLLDQQENTTVFAKDVPMNGGGKCEWRLSNITMGLQFNKSHPLSLNVEKLIGSYLVLIFDTNNPKRTGGEIKKIKGDLIVSKNYFPRLDKGFLGDASQLELLGRESYEYYDISLPRSVLWRPILTKNVYVITDYPATKLTKGVKIESKYSDGTVSQGENDNEMYKKLLSIANLSKDD